MEALISVIVPVYNVESYLSGCIESLLAQTHKNLEIILIDDGSTDKSGFICDEYANKDERIKVIHQKNSGVSAARNAGLDAAKGEYVGFVDSDDYVTEDMYGYLLSLCVKYDAEIVQIGRIYTNKVYSERECPEAKKEKLHFVDKEKALHELLCAKSVRSSLWSKLYKKKLFETIRLDTSLVNGEDGITNYQLISQTKRILLSNKVCYFYYTRQDSCTKGGVNEKIYNSVSQIHSYSIIEKNSRLKKSWKFNVALRAINYLHRSVRQNNFEHFEELRKYVVDAKSVLLQPWKYRVKGARLFHLYFVLIWLSPALYKKLILLKKR